MRTGNLTDMNGYSLQRIKIITEVPTVTSSNNGQIYLYAGDNNTTNVCVGDIYIVENGSLVLINRSVLNDTNNT